ncbi:hypothetical protein C5167_029062 [Papaver somniferum]|uniref:uncharacterized protein LOC113337130 n=1 Tax=Papaver somniferum TaxID=3469 RepID=UPI000E6F71FF|nr:uncharacterized protein LOC113337130 [Papaver somniferum]RZC89997.1 hypothetical protein C5167_029062 [Papaver somniferum]
MGITGTELSTNESATMKSPPPQRVAGLPNEALELVKCDCCGLTEECTLTYISKVKERYQGKWICGLCAEAVKDEISRSRTSSSEEGDKKITIEEALNLHMNFCKKFRCLSSSPPPNPTKHLVSAMKHLLRRSLDSPPSVLVRSSSSSSGGSDLIRTKKNSDHNVVHLKRSGSCFSTLAR